MSTNEKAPKSFKDRALQLAVTLSLGAPMAAGFVIGLFYFITATRPDSSLGQVELAKFIDSGVAGKSFSTDTKLSETSWPVKYLPIHMSIKDLSKITVGDYRKRVANNITNLRTYDNERMQEMHTTALTIGAPAASLLLALPFLVKALRRRQNAVATAKILPGPA